MTAHSSVVEAMNVKFQICERVPGHIMGIVGANIFIFGPKSQDNLASAAFTSLPTLSVTESPFKATQKTPYHYIHT